METVRPVEASSTSSSSASTARSGLLRSVAAKLVRSRKAPPPKAAESDAKRHNKPQPQPQPHPKQQAVYLDDYTAAAAAAVFTRSGDKDLILKPKHHLQLQVQVVDGAPRVVHQGGDGLDPLLPGIFACVSAIKAAYAKIQIAQLPYDPKAVQAADVAVVDEFRRISQLKQGYYQARQQLVATEGGGGGRGAQLDEEEIREKKSLVKALDIAAKTLESELQSKEAEVGALKERLREIEQKNRALEHKLRHHPRTQTTASSSPVTPALLSTLDRLHLSGLDPTHFLTALRYAVRSVKDLVRVLVREMEAAGWDLDAAAAAAVAGAPLPPAARDLAFESYVCMGMFSDFHLGPGFRAPAPGAAAPADRRACFEEFAAARSCASAKDLARLRRPFAEFCRAKYAAIVRPEMEAAFFAGMDRRAMAEADLFVAFAEVSRRVWLLHWLYCSFEPGAQASVFRAAPGARYSEVYMDSVAGEAAASPCAAGEVVVGFTVVPGFQLRKTVIQCKVYLAAAGGGHAGR